MSGSSSRSSVPSPLTSSSDFSLSAELSYNSAEYDTLNNLREECAALSMLYTSVDKSVTMMEERLENMQRELHTLMEVSEDYLESDELSQEDLALERMVKQVEEMSKTCFNALQRVTVQDHEDQDNEDNDETLINAAEAPEAVEEENDELLRQSFAISEYTPAQAAGRLSGKGIGRCGAEMPDARNTGHRLLRKVVKAASEEGKKERRRHKKRALAKDSRYAESQAIWRGCW